MNTGFVPLEMLGSEEEVRNTRKSWLKNAKGLVALRRGQNAAYKPAKKRQRVKAFVLNQQIHTWSKFGAGQKITRYQIKKISGVYPDPYTWAHINFSTDKASDNISLGHAFGYGYDMKSNFDHD